MTTRSAARPQRTSGALPIAYEAQGQGEVVLFLHGIGGHRGNWRAELVHYGRAFRAVALDFRGYGDSAPIHDGFEFTDFVDDALQVLDALDCHQAHVVGLSMGALVAQALYARAPERILSLALVACRSAAEPVLPAARREAFIRDRLEPLRRGGPEALAQALGPTLVGRHASEEARHQVMASLRKVRPDAYVRVMEARMRVAPLLDPASIRVPVLVVGSDEDTVAPLPQMRALAAAIPGAELVEIDHAGHLINLEQPQRFHSALDAFLARTGGGR